MSIDTQREGSEEEREEPENGKRHVCKTKEKVSHTGLGSTVLLDLVEEVAKVISLLFPLLLEVVEGGDFRFEVLAGVFAAAVERFKMAVVVMVEEVAEVLTCSTLELRR